MSKKQLNMNGDGQVEGEDYVITSTGERVDLITVSATLLQKTQTSGILPSVPYRELATAFGENEKDELKADDLQNDEEKAQWAEYVKARDAVLEKRNGDFLKAILVKGTHVNESKIEEWKREQIEEWGFDIPDKNMDMKLEYIQMEIAPSQEDQMKIVLGVLGKSGVPEKELESVRAMFRGALRRDTVSETDDGTGEVGME